VASGIRIGTPALTTRGMKEPEMDAVAGFIAEILRAPEDETVRTAVHGKVRDLCERYPLYDPLM
jgi:glycine hydroxymethyltransferase